MSDAEDDLLVKAIAGDAGALSTLLERHCAELRGMLSIDRKWASVLEPEDVLQVTFLEAFLRIGHFQPAGPGAFVGWLNRIAQNNLRDAVKELSRAKRPQPNQRVAAGPREDSAVLLLAELGVTTTTPSRSAAQHEVRTAMEKALSLLPPDYGAAIRLYDLEGLSITDVAAKMGRSPGAVHMLRRRGHEHLREILGSETAYFSKPA